MKRRTFLKGAAVAGAAAGIGFDVSRARAEMRQFKIARTTETRSICPYCAVACGVIVHTLGDKAKNVIPTVVHVEGDPDSPINRGTLCPKGATLKYDIDNPNRIRTPKVRRPGSDHWEDVSWDDAIQQIARHIKTTRDRTFVARNARGQIVNRTPGIAIVGGCTDTNEFNYLQWKTLRWAPPGCSLFFAMIIGHIYLGTAAEPGTFRSMVRGTVTKSWAQLHHPRWYREVTSDQPKR